MLYEGCFAPAESFFDLTLVDDGSTEEGLYRLPLALTLVWSYGSVSDRGFSHGARCKPSKLVLLAGRTRNDWQLLVDSIDET